MSCKDNHSNLDVIGSTEYVDIGDYKNIPAKIDTGADSSSIWASHIEVDQAGVLHFQLFDATSPFYTGETLHRTDFTAIVVRNSSGHEQIRYRTHLSLKIAGHKIRASFNLSDRSRNNFPILIGRRTIASKFVVDVSQRNTPKSAKNPKTKNVQHRLEENPYSFHQKYIKDATIKSNRKDSK